MLSAVSGVLMFVLGLLLARQEKAYSYDPEEDSWYPTKRLSYWLSIVIGCVCLVALPIVGALHAWG